MWETKYNNVMLMKILSPTSPSQTIWFIWILRKMDKEPPLSPFKSTTRSITPQSTKVRILLWELIHSNQPVIGNSNFSNSKFKYFIDWSSESFHYSRRNRRSSFNITFNLNCLCFTGKKQPVVQSKLKYFYQILVRIAVECCFIYVQYRIYGLEIYPIYDCHRFPCRVLTECYMSRFVQFGQL